MIVKAHERYRKIKIKKNKFSAHESTHIGQNLEGTQQSLKEEDSPDPKKQDFDTNSLEQEVEDAFEDNNALKSSI